MLPQECRGAFGLRRCVRIFQLTKREELNGWLARVAKKERDLGVFVLLHWRGPPLKNDFFFFFNIKIKLNFLVKANVYGTGNEIKSEVDIV